MIFKQWLSSKLKDISYKYLNHYMWPRRLLNRKFSFDSYYPAGICLNLGGGPYFNRKGWINVDFIDNFSSLKNRLYLDLNSCTNEFPFSNVNAVYLSHTLEHFNFRKSLILLKKIHESLVDGGFLRIVVPDADLIIERGRDNDLEYFRPFFSHFKGLDENLLDISDLLDFLLCTPRCRFKINDNLYKTKKNKQWSFLFSRHNDEIVNILNTNDFQQDNRGSLHLSAYTCNLLLSSLHEIGFSKIYKSAFMQSRFPPMREAPIFDGTHPWLSLYIEAVK